MTVARTPVGVPGHSRWWKGLGPAAADGGVGAAHVVAGGLDFLAVAVGLFVDGLEVAPNWVMNSWQATEPEPPQKSPAASTSRTMDWCSASREGGLGADHRAVGIHVAELVTDRHDCSPNEFEGIRG